MSRATIEWLRRDTLSDMVWHQHKCVDIICRPSKCIAPRDGYNLSTLLQGIKGVSAKRCNKLLRGEGSFWMDESYDHIVRDAAELAALRDYIVDNPKKAGLKQHEYSLQIRNILVT